MTSNSQIKNHNGKYQNIHEEVCQKNKPNEKKFLWKCLYQ